MMRILTLLFLLIASSTYSQSIEFHLYIDDPCTGKIESAVLYYLKRGDSLFFSDDKGIHINVSKKGRYLLVSDETDEQCEIELKHSQNKDTLRAPSILEFLPPIKSYTLQSMKANSLKRILESRSTWRRCDQPINGKAKDFFSNGALRVEGTFKNGYAIGEVIRYYRNGKIRSIGKYDPRGVFISIKSFDRNGIEIKNP